MQKKQGGIFTFKPLTSDIYRSPFQAPPGRSTWYQDMELASSVVMVVSPTQR